MEGTARWLRGSRALSSAGPLASGSVRAPGDEMTGLESSLPLCSPGLFQTEVQPSWRLGCSSLAAIL